MAPTKSPNAILSETTTINSFVEQMIVLFDYWWSRGLVMIFYHACLLLPLTAGSSPANKLILITCSLLKDFFTFKPDESDHSTCHSCKCFWLVFYGNFFFCVCAVNISYTPDRAQYSLHMGYCI